MPGFTVRERNVLMAIRVRRETGLKMCHRLLRICRGSRSPVLSGQTKSGVGTLNIPDYHTDKEAKLKMPKMIDEPT